MAATAQVTQSTPPAEAAASPADNSDKKTRSFSLVKLLKKMRPAPAPEKKEEAKKAVVKRLGSATQAVSEVARCLTADDGPSRRMARIFWLSVFGMIGTGIAIGHFYAERFKDQDAVARSRQMAEFFEKQQEQSRLKQSLLNIGAFTIELKPEPGLATVRGFLNMAQVEIVAECDSKETCDYIEGHADEAKSQMTNALVAIDRESLLSKKGKMILKQNLIDRLNHWLPSGTIKNVYFSRLLIT